MSWKKIIKDAGYGEEDEEKTGLPFMSAEEKEEKKAEEARKNLVEDVANVLRELEEFEGFGMGQMDLAGEMEDLSIALGKVSVLLQDWL